MANNAICLVEGVAFIQSPRRSMIRVLQFASSARCVVFSGTKMEWLVIPWNRTGHRMLKRETVAGDWVGSECFVGRATRHVRHVFIGALLRGGPTARQRHQECQNHDGQTSFHKSASFTSTSSAPLSSSNS